MAVTSDDTSTKLSYRRYREGDDKHVAWSEQIFQASHTHKCPTYQKSTPPCQGSCPSGEDIRGYLNIVRGIEKPPAGMGWQEYAWRRLTEANPFPAVMGRVCPAPCESGCNRNEVEDHVGINSVEHFLGDWAIKNNMKFKKPEQTSGKKVAIIGAGPASLACAYQLALKGHACVVFDDHEFAGGMMRYGIPGFRTPREVLDAEIQRIFDLGVEFRGGVRIGKDITLEQLRKDYDAMFVGLGAQAGRALPCPGSDAPNVVTAMAFLRAFNDGRMRHVGKKVVVVGGGDVSIDVATVARRLGHIEKVHETDRPEYVIMGHIAHDVAEISAKQGAEVVLTSVMPRETMEANKHEVEAALAEGIAIRNGLAPIEVIKGPDGRARALKLAECEAKIKGGRLDINIKPGTELVIEADLIVSAVGQAVDWTGMEQFKNERGLAKADKNYQIQGQPGVFTGGDVMRPHLLTTAIGHGWIAANGIDAFLNGHEPEKRPKVDVHYFDMVRKLVETNHAPEEIKEPLRGTDSSKGAVHNYDDRSGRFIIPHEDLYLGHFGYTPRLKRKMTHISPEEVLGNYQERIEALSEQDTVAEAKRCMSCGLCFECDNCVVYCPQTAVFRVKKKDATTGRYVDTDYTKCIGCHICADVCPTGYIQMGLGE
jgi:NADPH-dependent glutamate synthase beta subunit-like oxidoreductase/Pyruvate/2-oxoacid:ferredoxin oxidoreductase delta subunit